jgi:histidine triad (HIT) family protein
MTIFEKIVSGEIPSHKIWENEDFLAFLDIRPIAPGHTLVIPKKAIDYLFEMDGDSYQKFLLAAKEVAAILKSKIMCERVCMAVIGFEVPHAHIHLIPARSISDFPWPGGKNASSEDLAKLAEKLR